MNILRGRREAARLLPLLALALLAGCSTPAPTGASILIPRGGGAGPRTAAAVIDDRARWPEDAIEVTAWTIRDDRLDLTVRYGGGCADHRLALVFGTAWMESYPVQVSALLSHDANGDVCRALFSGDVSFDLRPLRDAYRASYRTDSGTIQFTLRPAGTRVTYQF